MAKRKTPTGGISFQALKAQLQARTPRNVYLLVGEESLLHDEAIHELRESLLDPGLEPFDLDLLYGEEIDPVDLAARVATVPFAAERRLVIVKRAEGLRDVEQVLGRGGTGPGASVLVLDYSPGKGPPESLSGTRVDLSPPSDYELPTWARDWCKERGADLRQDAAEYLVGTVGSSLSDLQNEMEKLLLFAGDGRAIGPEEVEAVVGSRPGESVYALSECVLRGQGPEAARIAEALGLSRGAREMAFAQIGWDLLRVMKLKAALDEGVPRSRLARTSGTWPRWVSQWLSRAQEVPWRWLWYMADVLYCTDRDVKRGRIDLPRALDLVIAAAGPAGHRF